MAKSLDESAHRPGSPRADGEARLARATNRWHRARDQRTRSTSSITSSAVSARTHRRIAGGPRRARTSYSKLRADISEIADTLQGNLDKVVQHGKRADAIVKNMPSHSRQGSGEHRPVDINALVDESSTLPITGREPKSRASTSPWKGTLTRPLARLISFPAGDHADAAQPDLQRVLCGH